MITVSGFSKDPSLIPEGIAITFGKEMAETNGGQKAVMKYFLEVMEQEENYWMHKMKLWPKIEVADIYIITLNRLWGKAKFGWFEKNATYAYKADGSDNLIEWPRLVIVGPFIKCPFKRELKGFQGFRYTQKLF